MGWHIRAGSDKTVYGWRGEHKGEYGITRQGRREASKAE